MKAHLLKLHNSPYFLPIGAVICSLLWGSAFPAIRLAHKYFDTGFLANHIAFAGVRFTIAGFILLFFIKGKKELLRKSPKFSILTVALFQVVFQYILFYWGLNVAPAVLGAILVSTGSFWWVMLAPIVDKTESLRPKQLLAILLGFIGVVICVSNKDGDGDNYWSGAFFIGSSLCGTIATLLVRPINKKVPPHFLVALSLLVGGVILISMTPKSTLMLLTNPDLKLVGLTLWLAFVSAAAFSLWYYLVTIFDVPRLSGYRMLIPVFGVLESVLLLKDEVLHWNYLTGGLVVLSGIYFLEKIKRTKAGAS
ncbi:MAG: DMT family transporter [Lentisphaeraceae bacterium]|nr:DMT family transporter [Lentisphaeraceae bacterium]